MNHELTIDAHFPGGNIAVETIKINDVFLHQDLRDTPGWFYWAFQVSGAHARRLTFHFTGGDVLGVRGPAMSNDNGTSWQWLGDEIVSRENPKDVQFSYDFSPQHTKVLFAFCPIYTQVHLDNFLAKVPKSTFVRKDILCHSRAGREVEFLHLGNPDAAIKVLLSCRHHACEAMASYFLEGVLEAFLSEDEIGKWFRENVDCAVAPFVDKDGVEAGDQGKNREPHDHNRDYAGEISDSIYPEVAALRRWLMAWPREQKSCIVLDFHCPHIRGNENEYVYFVGVPDQQIWQEVNELSAIWESLPSGSIRFEKSNNLPFGEKWNTGNNYAAGKSFTKWASELSTVRLAAAMGMPYANASGTEVTPASCRALGRNLAAALREYIKDSQKKSPL
jgi:hypothetical protein